MREINVLYCFDTRFWKLAMVSMHSLLKSKNPDTVCNIYCMVAPGTKGRKEISKLPCNLIWREIKQAENPFNSFDYKRWSPVIFYRLFAHKIFPNIDRILYLDSDTLIFGDLYELFNTDMTNFVMAGAIDCALVDDINNIMGRYVKEFKEKYVPNGLYINSGVLLIDLQQKHELDKLSAPIDSTPLLCPDQDLINMKLSGKIKRISLRYNYTNSVTPKDYDTKDAKEAKNNCVIYHFYTQKPYFFNGKNRRIFSAFMKYAKELGWTQKDFLKMEIKYQSNKTNVSFVRIKNNKIKLFGITLVTL